MKMNNITLYNSRTKTYEEEAIYGELFLRFVYENGFGKKFFLPLISKHPAISKFYGWLQSRPHSKKKIEPFVAKYGVDLSECIVPPGGYSSFNEFFMRRLKIGVRDLKGACSLPADGRYLAFQEIDRADRIYAKGQTLSLERLIGDRDLAKKYQGGSLVIARLAPPDYHCFHAPCSGSISLPHLLGRSLFSVNPIALRRRISYLYENKRYRLSLESQHFGKVLLIAIGATNVGSMFFEKPGAYECGDLIGGFSFGGSMLITIFEKGAIQIDPKLLERSAQGIETLGFMGQSLTDL